MLAAISLLFAPACGDAANRLYGSLSEVYDLGFDGVALSRVGAFLVVEYVRGREQFGVPIGSFQSVQHRLADLATERDGARLLVWEAAWAADAERARASTLAAMAFWWSARTAEAVTTDALHFHGGYGFTLAQDIQLYFRRAKAWPLALGDLDRQLLTVAGRCFGAVDDREVVRA